MTNNETNLFVVALRYRIRYDNCNPEVGRGPSHETLLKGLEKEAGIVLTQPDRNIILAKFK